MSLFLGCSAVGKHGKQDCWEPPGCFGKRLSLCWTVEPLMKGTSASKKEPGSAQT